MKSRWRFFVVTACAVAIAALVWSPAFEDPAATGYGDWQMVIHNWETGVISLSRHGEWPLWDPYHCGGVTIFGNPESQHFSPLFFLALILGTNLALKLFVVLHAIAGFSGMFVLARRRYGLEPAGAALAAVAWGASGFFAWHGSGGHGTFLPFFLAPWVLLAWRRAVDDPRWCAALAALMVFVVLEGGTYPFPYFVVLLAFDAAVLMTDRDKRTDTVRAAAVSGALALLGSAIRLVPVREALALIPRQVESTDAVELPDVVAMLTNPDHPYRWGHQYVWAEYGTFVGWGVVVLAIAGAWVALRRGRKHLTVALLLFGALMLGSRGSFHPWPVLHQLPVYDSLRVPSRFAVLFSLYLALLAGLAVTHGSRWLAGLRLRRSLDWTRAVLPWLLVVPLGARVVDGNWDVVDRWDGVPLDTSDPAERFHLLAAQNYNDTYASFPRQNVGTPRCYIGGMNWPVARGLWLGDVAQARVEGTAGEVRRWGRTNNTVWAEVSLPQAGRVVFNQNHFPDWHASAGTVVNDDGRLAADLPAGDRRVVLRYRPASLPWAAGLSVLGIVLCVLVARFGTRARLDAPWHLLARILGLRRVAPTPDG